MGDPRHSEVRGSTVLYPTSLTLVSQLSLRHHTVKKVLSYLNQPESISVAGDSELGNVHPTTRIL